MSLFHPFSVLKRIICQDRLGTNIKTLPGRTKLLHAGDPWRVCYGGGARLPRATICVCLSHHALVRRLRRCVRKQKAVFVRVQMSSSLSRAYLDTSSFSTMETQQNCRFVFSGVDPLTGRTYSDSENLGAENASFAPFYA
jgi:hypothetical protein